MQTQTAGPETAGPELPSKFNTFSFKLQLKPKNENKNHSNFIEHPNYKVIMWTHSKGNLRLDVIGFSDVNISLLVISTLLQFSNCIINASICTPLNTCFPVNCTLTNTMSSRTKGFGLTDLKASSAGHTILFKGSTVVLLHSNSLRNSPKCRTKKTLGQDYHLNGTTTYNFSISANLPIFLSGRIVVQSLKRYHFK